MPLAAAGVLATGMRKRSFWRLIARGLAVGAMLALPATAAAHANLVRSDPQTNANLAQAPARVQLWFSERPEVSLTQIQVFDAQRKEVELGSPQAVTDDPLSLTEAVQPSLPQGVYTVSWKTTSAVDGHVTAGAFAFGIGVAPTPADLAAAQQATTTPPPSPISVVIRWLEYLAGVGLLGLALFGMLVVEPAGGLVPTGTAGERLADFQRRLTRAGVGLGWLLVVSVFAALLDQVRLSGGRLSPGAFQAVLGTGLGIDLVARLGIAIVVLAVLLVWPRAMEVRGLSPHRSLGAAAAGELSVAGVPANWPRTAIVTGLLAELLLYALSSHALAVSNAPELALMNDWLHLSVAGVWVGGLIALALAVVPAFGGRAAPKAGILPDDLARNQLFGPVVSGFSRVALISAVGLVATGFYQALAHVGTLENALDTDYGKALILKTAIFALALLLAAFHRWMLVPSLRDPGRAPATRARRFLSRTLPLEALLVVAVLAVTGLLTNLPPANAAGSPDAQIKTMGDTRVMFEIVPLRVGPNLFQVTLESKGKPVDNAEKVELQLTMLDMDMGQSVIDLQPKGNGVYSAEGDTMSMSGRWQIDLLLRLPGQLDQRTTFDVVAKT
ncbi:MAG TPA: copper resistance protein CopC [Chloroflexota bacterium]|nr:copper resistance protein CopC [Chloroflexota bacterium]